MPAPLGPRNRDFHVRIPGTCTQYVWWQAYGFLYDRTTTVAGQREAKLVVNNPYRPSKPPGLRPPTSRKLTFEKTVIGYRDNEFVNPVNGWRYRRVGYSDGAIRTAYNRLIGFRTQWTSKQAQLRNEALVDMISKVKQQQWNAGVMLAESAGVATMLVDAAALISKTRQLIRKGDFAEAYRRFREAKPDIESYPSWRRRYLRNGGRDRLVRRARYIPQGWLYYHFGIKPTVNDIDDAVTSFMSRKNDMEYEYGGFATGYARETWKHSEVGRIPTSDQEYGELLYSTLYSVRIKCFVRPKPGFLNRLSALGVTNPPDAIWNGIPFSWLVDYFSSVGDWLNTLDAGLGWQWDTNWTESWREVTEIRFVPLNGGTNKYVSPLSQDKFTRKFLDRNVRGDLYGPMGQVLPRLKRKGPSPKRIANVLSVLASSFRGSPRI